ncbi:MULTISPECIES: beta-N-acetylhexosaminidase [unclassified Novosphingobium]|uniref:beta-N-acetylhexosaminidase n=1 Tax=unclassified Novosphingobium TaxID=2644732 RepID=UPI0025E0CE31|nr:MULTISPECIES: beta-N-acetylhexosaminidase [unclassified Novosphingobium]HQV03404.1 beta-N-acetylhexosaminidase [Novosphingobium sp.]
MTPAIFGLSGLVLTADERAFFREADPAGYIIFGRNVESREQLRGLTDALREIHGREKLLITIDQEGGRVQRMKPPVWPQYPAGAAFDRLYDVAPASAIEAARANAEALGIDLAEVGITCTHAPVLDVRQESAHDVIGDRAMGHEPLRVAALGRAVLDGLARAGIAGTIKHMPGHGRTTCDTHKAMPTVAECEAELEADIAPFRALNDAPSGMTGHLKFTAWDTENPATQSLFIIEQIIRGKIGFDGLLFTDDLDMEALSGTVPERAERSVAAGCDLALNCWARMDDMIGICERLPTMNEKTAERLARTLSFTRLDNSEGDQSALIAKRDALLALAETAA